MTPPDQRLTNDEYMRHVEGLALQVVDEAIEEESFEVYLDEGSKAPLQEGITRLVQNLRHAHFQGDGCIPGELPE